MKSIILNQDNIGTIIDRIRKIAGRYQSVKFFRNSDNPGTKLGKVRRNMKYTVISTIQGSFLDVSFNHRKKIVLCITEPSSGRRMRLLEGCRFHFVGDKTVIIRIIETDITSQSGWCKMEYSDDYVVPTNIDYGGYWQSGHGGWEYEYGYQNQSAKYTGRYRHSSQRDLIYDPRNAVGKKYLLAS